MGAATIVASRGVEVDASGVGHCWRRLDVETASRDILEEIAAWVLEDGPTLEEEMVASNGQHYRLGARVRTR